MKVLTYLCLSSAGLCLMVSSTVAQVETIGPLTLQPQQTNVQIFTNMIPPNPLYKELQFTGMIDVPPGAIADLFVEFDYQDLNGNSVVVPAPTSMFTAVGGQPNPVDTGILTLMFCPQVVSLHLTNLDQTGVSMDVQGLFRHECFAVPEPVSSACLPIAVLLLAAVRRRQGKTQNLSV